MQILVTLTCCLCPARHTISCEVPEGWAAVYDTMEEERTLCPTHQPIQAFVDAQCPGCVGGWMDCDLWKAFAYRRRALTDEDFAAMTQGICPRRTKGSLVVDRRDSRTTITDINLSQRAPRVSGAALVQAIQEYWAREDARDRLGR